MKMKQTLTLCVHVECYERITGHIPYTIHTIINHLLFIEMEIRKIHFVRMNAN